MYQRLRKNGHSTNKPPQSTARGAATRRFGEIRRNNGNRQCNLTVIAGRDWFIGTGQEGYPRDPYAYFDQASTQSRNLCVPTPQPPNPGQAVDNTGYINNHRSEIWQLRAATGEPEEASPSAHFALVLND